MIFGHGTFPVNYKLWTQREGPKEDMFNKVSSKHSFNNKRQLKTFLINFWSCDLSILVINLNVSNNIIYLSRSLIAHIIAGY